MRKLFSENNFRKDLLFTLVGLTFQQLRKCNSRSYNDSSDSSDEEVLFEFFCFLLNHHQEQIKRKRKRMWVHEAFQKRIEKEVYNNLLQEVRIKDRESHIKYPTGTPRRIDVDSTWTLRRYVKDQISTNFHVISAYFFDVISMVQKSTWFPRTFFDVISLI